MTSELAKNLREVDPTAKMCVACLKSADSCKLLRCAGCHFSRYCSKACQKKHWPKHKKLCKEIRTDGIDAYYQKFVDRQKQTADTMAEVGLPQMVSAEQQMADFVDFLRKQEEEK